MGITTVSYTHLDVYKRQSQGSAEGPGNNTPVSPGTGAEPGGSPAGPSQDLSLIHI